MTDISALRVARFLASWCLVGACATSLAQSAPAGSDYEPQRGQLGKDVIWIPTPDAVVNRMLQMAEVKPTDRLFDLGSGDGKIAIAAAKNFGARATGLEYNPDMVGLSVRRAQEAGVSGKVNFQQADIFVTDFSSATVVTMYLLPELNLRLRPTLLAMAPGTRVVSHSFSMGDWEPDEVAGSGEGEVFLWRVPANASGTWKLTGSGLGANATMNLTQNYQMVKGNVMFGELRAGLVRPQLSGDQLRFELRDVAGVMLRVDAKIAKNRMTGTLHRAGQAPARFEAVRDGEPAPITQQVHEARQTLALGATLAAGAAR